VEVVGEHKEKGRLKLQNMVGHHRHANRIKLPLTSLPPIIRVLSTPPRNRLADANAKRLA